MWRFKKKICYILFNFHHSIKWIRMNLFISSSKVSSILLEVSLFMRKFYLNYKKFVYLWKTVFFKLMLFNLIILYDFNYCFLRKNSLKDENQFDYNKLFSKWENKIFQKICVLFCIILNFYFKFILFILCMSVCVYVEINAFENKKKTINLFTKFIFMLLLFLLLDEIFS